MSSTESSVTEAVVSRRSVRAFSNRSVERTVVEELLQLAANAPSNGNTQPWRVHVVTGEAKENLSKAIFEKAASSPSGAAPDIEIYPKDLGEPWRSRRYACGELMYETLGIERENKVGRMQQAAKNLSFFGAPIGIIVTLDRSLAELQFLDCGIFMQTFMLLAQERGLATCPQAAWSMWAGVIRRQLGLSDQEMVLAGIALGYPDTAQVASNIPMPRISLDEFATFHDAQVENKSDDI